MVEFSILADEDEAEAAHQAATSLQSSTTPLSLSIAGEIGKSNSQGAKPAARTIGAMCLCQNMMRRK